MNCFKKTTLLLILIFAASTNFLSQKLPPVPTAEPRSEDQFKLGIAYSSSLRSNKEQFEFVIGRVNDSSNTQKVVLNSASPIVYFQKTFRKGESYAITQISGPRTCFIQDDYRARTFNNSDILVYAQCGNPPLSIYKFEISGIEQGEVFQFKDGHGRGPAQFNSNTTITWGGFPQGDDYAIVQTDGPRKCRMMNNQGVVPTTQQTVKADCSKNPPITPIPATTPNPTSTQNPPTATANSFKDFELVSRSSDDKIVGTFYETFTPVIGGTGDDEGRYVAFVTYTKGLGGSGKYRQVIWRDRKTGETRIVSQSNGIEGNQNSGAPAISADGKSVAFESYATNLVSVDGNGVRDVFVWNYNTNTVSAVSENRGTEANSECFEPTISADGNLIAFSSSADNLAPGVSGTSTVNVYLRDMRSGQVTLISKKEKDGKGGGGSNPSISEDGSRIAFYNYFPLTEEDKNNLWDIYVWQSGMPKLKRITKTAAGGEKDQGSESASRVVSPTISGDGRFVTFATTATNMIGNDTMKIQNAYLAEIDTGRITILSSNGGSSADDDTPFGQGESIALSSDGRQTVFSSKAKNLNGRLILGNSTEGLVLRSILPLNLDGVDTSISIPRLSRNGKCIIFGSNMKLDKRFPSSGIFVTCK